MSLLSDLASFPAAGRYSIARYPVPRNSGTVPVTELRNILDTSWSRNALDRTASVARGSSWNPGCLTSNGLVNAGALALGIAGAGNRFDLAGLNKMLGATGKSMSSVLGDLQMASSLQSLGAGLAKSISSTSGTMFFLLDKALGVSPAAAQNIMTTASAFLAASSRGVDLFSGAFQLAGRGRLGSGAFSPGEVFSGMGGKLESMLGGAGSVLSAGAGGLADSLGDLGVDFMLPPDADLGDLASLFDPITGSLTGVGEGVGDALASLNADTLDGVAEKIGAALEEAEAGGEDGYGEDTADIIRKAIEEAEGEADTIDRFQGIQLIDGEWKDTGFSVTKKAMVGLAALLALFALKNRRKGGSSAMLGGSAAMVLLASLLGGSAPVSGSFLATQGGGWLGSPASASRGISSAMAEACAFNSAMMAALGGFLGSGSSAIDALMAALECRRSTYDRMYGTAYGAYGDTNYLLDRMSAILALLNSGAYPDLCASSGLGLGRCA